MIYSINGTSAVAKSFDMNIYYVTDAKNKTYEVTNPFLNMSLIAHDDFESLNQEIWNVKTGAYRDIWLPDNSENNIAFQNNELHIKCIKDYPETGYEWSGAFLSTKGKKEFVTGGIKCKVKYPDTDYYHSTIWMLASENNGEIDIAESDSGNTNATLYYYNNDKSMLHRIGLSYGFPPTLPTEFNEFIFLKDSEYLYIYCNNILYSYMKISKTEIDGYNSLSNPFYFIVNILPNTSFASHNQSSISPIETIVKDFYMYSMDV